MVAAEAAIQAAPSYTFIVFDVVLKYKAPVASALPSLSKVGSEALVPRYRSSKLSSAEAAAAAEEAADVALVLALLAWVVAVLAEAAAFVSLVEALLADVLAAEAELAALVADVLALLA